MDKYEEKELIAFLKVKIDLDMASNEDKELYQKIISEHESPIAIDKVMFLMAEKGWLYRKDVKGYLGLDENGHKLYCSQPYYILTDKGLREFKKKIKKYKRPKIRWDVVISALSILVTILLQRCAG